MFILTGKQSVYNDEMKKEVVDLNSIVVNRLNQLIEQNGISKAEMARIAGVTSQAVNNWFKRGDIGKKSAQKIAAKMGVSVDWILGESDNLSPNNPTRAESALTPKEKILLELFNELPESERDKLLKTLEEQKYYFRQMLEELLENQGKRKA
ncbi:helix-turn-helix domain-containing protein [Yersinia alsatica]|uniref:helix-turn-helix domain-containing protein n=1 Tax=Yersinia TaxID=629 RepID=UPI0011A988B6|nr:helix-turn-helix domain-containing protein [Yersinia alsatica]HDL7926712.1 helix-turn-helix domain-containing protein [Yersinia enterocolitica]